MTHRSGLKCINSKYIDEAIKDAFDKKTQIPNPIEPEDFLIYADEDIEDSYKACDYNFQDGSGEPDSAVLVFNVKIWLGLRDD